MVVDYLMEVVLDQQSDERRDFLLETSVLQELCGSLCDAVTGRPDSAGVLARLERENLFRVALDDRREWFRYHHLFALALNEELGRYRTRRPELHRRAGAWFEATGDLGQAIHHAFAGGDLDTAATLVATHWFELVNLGRVATVRGWLDTFPRPIIDADARLLLVEAWISGLHGDAQAGLRAVSAARRVGYEGSIPTVPARSSTARRWSEPPSRGPTWARCCPPRVRLTNPNPNPNPSASGSPGGRPWPRSISAGRSSSRASQSRRASRSCRPSRWHRAVSSGWLPAMRGRCSPRPGSRRVISGRRKRGSAMPSSWRPGSVFADLPSVGFSHLVAGTIDARRGDHEEAEGRISVGLIALGLVSDEGIPAAA